MKIIENSESKKNINDWTKRKGVISIKTEKERENKIDALIETHTYR